MTRPIILLACIVGQTLGTKTCDLNRPTQDIDWEKVPRGPWMWALHTPDEYQDNFSCSRVAISGTTRNGIKSFVINQKYGPQAHQIYEITGRYQSPAVYRVPRFGRAWRNVLIHNLSIRDRLKIFRGVVDSPMAGLVSFLTDYNNYLITSTCMPTGDVSVTAYTMHKRVTPLLERRIRGVLKQNNITTNPIKLNCKAIINRRNRLGKRPFQ